MKISVDDKSIEVTEEEFEFLKKYIIRDSIDFILDGFNDEECPIELFDEEMVKYRGDFFNNLQNKLKEIF